MRIVASGLALLSSGLAIWACATAAIPIDNTDVPETGAPDTGQASNDAGCPQYNIDIDPKHCGSCTRACTDLQVCSGGACKAACDLPTIKCVGDAGGGCIDPTKDPLNCGGCNVKCPVADAGSLPTDNGNDSGIPPYNDAGVDSGIPPQAGSPTCATSKCGVTCPPNMTACSDNVCYDTQNNHDHCGSCMTACAVDTEWCTAGHCCMTGQEYCNGACIDVLSDAKNCGACGAVCPMNAPSCGNGQCGNATHCASNSLWTPVNCTTPQWVWSADKSKAMTVQAASTQHILRSGCQHSNINSMCSLTGTGWVSTKIFTMSGCNTSWYHLGGSYTGACGGHDGDQIRYLAMGPDDCYNY